MNRSFLSCVYLAVATMLGATSAMALPPPPPPPSPRPADCPGKPGDLAAALIDAAGVDKTGLDNDYWAVVVNREGVVCDVAFSGKKQTDQWMLSRQIAAAKAFTAVGLSLDKAAVSTGALYAWVQSGAPATPKSSFPGFAPPNPLYGLNGGNVQDASQVYEGSLSDWGTAKDNLIGKKVGGTITFGGGLGLYGGDNNNTLIGGLGLSGDTACADHSTAWQTRIKLKMTPGVKVSKAFDPIKLTNDASGHPHCPNDKGTQGTTP